MSEGEYLSDKDVRRWKPSTIQTKLSKDGHLLPLTSSNIIYTGWSFSVNEACKQASFISTTFQYNGWNVFNLVLMLGSKTYNSYLPEWDWNLVPRAPTEVRQWFIGRGCESGCLTSLPRRSDGIIHKSSPLNFLVRMAFCIFHCHQCKNDRCNN